MSDLDLEPIKARLDKAHTERGPWKAKEDSWDGYSVAIDDNGPGVSIIAEQIGQGEDEGREDAEFIAHAPEDIRALLGAVKAAKSLHRKMPFYDTPADECTEHDPDIYGIELDYAGEWYCSQHVAEWVCAECFTDDGEYVEYPCDTMRALGVTEQ